MCENIIDKLDKDCHIPVIINTIRTNVTVFDISFDLVVQAGKLNIAIDIVNDHRNAKVIMNINDRAKLIPYITFNIAPLCDVISTHTDDQKIDMRKLAV
ncbi:TPA: hypothetical protein ACX6SS_000542 [Photobacterium damselae]